MRDIHSIHLSAMAASRAPQPTLAAHLWKDVFVFLGSFFSSQVKQYKKRGSSQELGSSHPDDAAQGFAEQQRNGTDKSSFY